MNSIHHQFFLDPFSIKRNLAIVGEQGHGKTTLFNLICINESMKMNFQTHHREIVNNNILNHQNVLVAFENQTQSFLLNIFDTSGGYENNLDVENIFRIVDGFILVIDIVEGFDDYTLEILKSALLDNIQPILFLSKFDETLQIFNSHSEQLYLQINQIITELNEFISTFNFNNPNIQQFDFSQGNVIFGSNLYDWGIDVDILQAMHSDQDILKCNEFVKYLWKNDEFNPQGFHIQDLIKFFTDFIINPILQMQEEFQNSNKSISNKQSQFNQSTKECKFQKQISLCGSLYNKIIKFIPSPKQAQIQRAQNFFLQSENEIVFNSIQNCDSSGPLIVYICKFFQIKDDQVIAVCKVLSGTLQANQIVKIMSSNYMYKSFDDDKGIWKITSKKSELHEIEIQKMILLNGSQEQITNAQCGNIIGIIGLEKLLKENGIMTEYQYEIIIKPNRLKQLNIVKVLIQPEESKMLPQMLEAIKQQEQIDQQLCYYSEESGERVLLCCSNKHQEKTLNQLRLRFQKQNLKIKISDPFVEMRETVIGKSNFKFLATSKNKSTRLYAAGEQICDDLVNAIESKTIDVQGSIKDIALKFDIEFNWEFDEAKRIICFGPERTGANILVNQVISNEQQRILKDVNSMMGASFQWSTKEGALAEENVRGLKINFHDFIQRGELRSGGLYQIIPTARRLFYICQLTAKTRIQEPFSKTAARVSYFQIDEIFKIIQQNQGVILSERQIYQSSDSIIKFYHPTSKSHILQREIDFLTVQKGIWKEQFDCWVTLISDPTEIGTKAYECCLNIRKRKGLKLEIPNLEKFMDEE